MNLCSDDHEEVCFESKQCPACEAIKDRDAQIRELESKISDLNEDLESLKEAQGEQ